MTRQKLPQIALTAVLAVALTGCSLSDTVSGLWSRVLEAAGISETQQQEEPLQENQREIYGQVISAVGNEITLELGTLQTAQAQLTSPEDQDDPAAQQPGTAGTGEPAAGNSSGNASNGRGGGGMDAGAAFPQGDGTRGGTGEMPSAPEGMSGMPDGAAAPGSTGGTGTANAGARMQGGISLELTGEQQTYQIPPSVPVEYSMGDQTLTLSFTRISADNRLRLVLQTLDNGSEAVVKVQILG